ncbi:hypothetical protein AXG93_1603s1050 [Marchantia polymorpha subsp. ruderalis]|uniref:Uncharacterized protein n=1 Tax=Marchantia polymorpha subsp. ruderalis TaxID=1480154 RepID=A0A176VUW2_MARPO|nr:hypothetical protein AXG93_1603s1050 [Marchantia polymorpha subsp. ruderalis]
MKDSRVSFSTALNTARSVGVQQWPYTTRRSTSTAKFVRIINIPHWHTELHHHGVLLLNRLPASLHCKTMPLQHLSKLHLLYPCGIMPPRQLQPRISGKLSPLVRTLITNVVIMRNLLKSTQAPYSNAHHKRRHHGKSPQINPGPICTPDAEGFSLVLIRRRQTTFFDVRPVEAPQTPLNHPIVADASHASITGACGYVQSQLVPSGYQSSGTLTAFLPKAITANTLQVGHHSRSNGSSVPTHYGRNDHPNNGEYSNDCEAITACGSRFNPRCCHKGTIVVPRCVNRSCHA